MKTEKYTYEVMFDEVTHRAWVRVNTSVWRKLFLYWFGWEYIGKCRAISEDYVNGGSQYDDGR